MSKKTFKQFSKLPNNILHKIADKAEVERKKNIIKLNKIISNELNFINTYINVDSYHDNLVIKESLSRYPNLAPFEKKIITDVLREKIERQKTICKLIQVFIHQYVKEGSMTHEQLGRYIQLLSRSRKYFQNWAEHYNLQDSVYSKKHKNLIKSIKQYEKNGYKIKDNFPIYNTNYNNW